MLQGGSSKYVCNYAENKNETKKIAKKECNKRVMMWADKQKVSHNVSCIIEFFLLPCVLIGV